MRGLWRAWRLGMCVLAWGAGGVDGGAHLDQFSCDIRPCSCCGRLGIPTLYGIRMSTPGPQCGAESVGAKPKRRAEAANNALAAARGVGA